MSTSDMQPKFVRSYSVSRKDEIVEGEMFRFMFGDDCRCGFAIASNGQIIISGEFEGQVMKLYCSHGNSISMMM